jgi:hypothetical protein
MHHRSIAEHALEMRFERLQIQKRFVYVEYQNSRHAFILHSGAMGQPTCFRAEDVVAAASSDRGNRRAVPFAKCPYGHLLH